jgi:geranylgeranyl diphosphate synthase type II
VNLRAEIAVRRRAIDRALGRYVPARADPLSRAMRYGLFPGGKRLRAVLLLAAGEAVGGRRRALLPFACAVEMIHTYSLIHDDLPAMDDDLLRRGRPTAHRVFGEGMAILAGDALLTEAFRVMAGTGDGSARGASRTVAAIETVAAAAGMRGMVGGQVSDLAQEGRTTALVAVRAIHRRKTGALIEAAVQAGALVAGAPPRVRADLGRYGRCIGLAFQIADDLRDARAPTAETGKVARRDRARGKATYPAVLGVAAAEAALRREIMRAAGALRTLGSRGRLLELLAGRVEAWGLAGRAA